MAKGWSVVELAHNIYIPETKEEKKRKNKRFAKAIKAAENATLKDPKQDIERLKKEGEDLYYAKVNEEEKLLDAYKRKVVKSEVAIDKAHKILKERAAAEKKRKVKTDSNTKAEA